VPRSLIDLAGLNVTAEDLLGAVLDTAAQPIWVLDPDGVVRFANPAAIAALGYDSGDELVGCESHERLHYRHPDGASHPVDECPLLLPRTTGESATIDLDWFFRRDGSMLPVSYVSAPVPMEKGRGVVVAFTDVECRLRPEREERERDETLAAQQESVRRLAGLVAGGAASREVFAAIASEVARVLGLQLVEVSRFEPEAMVSVIGAWSDRPQPFEAGTQWPVDWPTVSAQVQRTGQPVRLESYAQIPGVSADAARERDIVSAAGAPIVVDGELWGVMATYWWGPDPLPDRIEHRLAEFTALIAAAFSGTARRDEVVRLADEQEALRRVATLVARGVPPSDVFAAVAREVGLLVGGDSTHVGRYDVEGTVTLIASWSRAGDQLPVGAQTPLDRENVCSLVKRTGRPARMNSYKDASGPIAAMLRELGTRSSVGAPIVVDGRQWGVTIVSSKRDHPLPSDTAARIAAFTDLVGTAISNTEARSEARRLADEQAALRRVATLVARGVPESELFGATVEEAGKLFGAELAGMIRFVTDDSGTAVATWAAEGEHPEVQGVWPLESSRLATTILRTAGPSREDDWGEASGPIAEFVREELGIRSSVGSPIVVEGRAWGALFVHSTTAQPLPRTTETRLANFTELVATAMSNAQARSEVHRLAQEQAALRRVATLVARGVPPDEVWGAIAEEVQDLFRPDAGTGLLRVEPGGRLTLVGVKTPLDIEVGRSFVAEEGAAALAVETGRPARVDTEDPDATSPDSELPEFGSPAWRRIFRTQVAIPIAVEGRLWGVTVTSWMQQAPPPRIEARVAEFTELLATALANADSRAELAASRARIVMATDEARRRFERDLHDGAQTRLVALALELQSAEALTPEGLEDLRTQLLHVGEGLIGVLDDLRELSRGLHPAILSEGGLELALRALARRSAVPVELDVRMDGRLEEGIEVAAYYVVSEALANAAKHADASVAEINVEARNGVLDLMISDNGVGGADPARGSGLVGLKDRVEALGGTMAVVSPPGAGTSVHVELPVDIRAASWSPRP
jgi:PAS domain S-box-containing protein